MVGAGEDRKEWELSNSRPEHVKDGEGGGGGKRVTLVAQFSLQNVFSGTKKQ